LNFVGGSPALEESRDAAEMVEERAARMLDAVRTPFDEQVERV
jgi:hypothetical protein